jgi:RNA polymerase sigma-70 factor (ECF subfamily)
LPSVNSALQRARATLEQTDVSSADAPADLDEPERELLERYVEAFERYDMEALTALIHEDATQSMPRTTCGSAAGTTS